MKSCLAHLKMNLVSKETQALHPRPHPRLLLPLLHGGNTLPTPPRLLLSQVSPTKKSYRGMSRHSGKYASLQNEGQIKRSDIILMSACRI